MEKNIRKKTHFVWYSHLEVAILNVVLVGLHMVTSKCIPYQSNLYRSP